MFIGAEVNSVKSVRVDRKTDCAGFSPELFHQSVILTARENICRHIRQKALEKYSVIIINIARKRKVDIKNTRQLLRDQLFCNRTERGAVDTRESHKLLKLFHHVLCSAVKGHKRKKQRSGAPVFAVIKKRSCLMKIFFAHGFEKTGLIFGAQSQLVNNLL